jgi:hypothetical protein
MSARMLVELADGNIILFGGGPVAGLPDVGLSDDFTRATTETFASAFESLGALFKMLDGSLKTMPEKADKVELEFAATLSRDCDLWIVSGGGPAEFKIKVSWSR